jgi:hypothetical protein
MLSRRTAAARWIVVATSLLAVACVSKSRSAQKPELPAVFELPKEGESTNLDSIRAYLDTFSRGPLHAHSRPAICADRSVAGGCVDSVTIQAIGLSKDIKAGAGPAPGRVIGQIRNLDARNLTEMDSLKPASQADYYIYLDRDTSGHARWNLLEVPIAHAGIIRRIVQQEVNQCGEKPGYEWPQSDVDFANCGDHALQGMVLAEIFTPAGVSRLFSLVAKYTRAQPTHRRGKWYGCSNGCCT